MVRAITHHDTMTMLDTSFRAPVVSFREPLLHSIVREVRDHGAYWALRIGSAMCYIGHGAFGFITKAAWLPYFAVVGIPESWAWKLMPPIGAVDVTIGMMILFAPRRLPLLYMAVWGLWTALLRPLSGESAFEAIERAGNYGVPLALLLMSQRGTGIRSWLGGVVPPVLSVQQWEMIRRVLWVTTVMVLAGHGLLAVVTGKAIFARHYAAANLPAGLTAPVGWFELALAALIAWRPMVSVLLFVCVWKVATESLYFVAGAPIWEVVERGGSYAAPLALALMLAARVRESRTSGARSA